MKKVMTLWVLVFAVAGMFSCSNEDTDVSRLRQLETGIYDDSKIEIDATAREYTIKATNVRQMFIVNAYGGETKKQLNIKRESNNTTGKELVTETCLKEGWLYATTALKEPNQLRLVAAANIWGKERSILLVLDCDGEMRTFTVIQKAK